MIKVKPLHNFYNNIFSLRNVKHLAVALYLYLCFLANNCYSAEPVFNITADEGYKSILSSIVNRTTGVEAASEKKITVTLGADSLKAALLKADNTSILALYITSKEFKTTLVESTTRVASGRAISAVFTDIDPRLPAHLANILSPIGKKYVPYTLASQLSLTSNLELSFKELGAGAYFIEQADTKRMLQMMDSNDVLIAYPDDSLFNQLTIKPIVASLYRRKKFMIGYSSAITKAGALASIYASNDHYLEQCISIINELNLSGRLPSSVYASNFDISVNPVLAKALGYYSNDVNEANLKQAVEKFKLNARLN